MDGPIHDAFIIAFNRDRFCAADFKPNFSLSGQFQYDIPQTLAVYGEWLGRFFVSVGRARHAAEVKYDPGTDRICGIAAEHDLTSWGCKELFGHMGILTSAETSANAVEWYAGLPSTLGLDQVLRRPIALPWDTRLARENERGPPQTIRCLTWSPTARTTARRRRGAS